MITVKISDKEMNMEVDGTPLELLSDLHRIIRGVTEQSDAMRAIFLFTLESGLLKKYVVEGERAEMIRIDSNEIERWF